MLTANPACCRASIVLCCLLPASPWLGAADRPDNPTTDLMPAGIDWEQAPVLTIRMGDAYFDPEELTLQLQRPYRIILDNISDSATHNISSEPLFHSVVLRRVTIGGVTINTPHLHHMTLRPNSQAKLYLVPFRAGEMEFHCNVPGHVEAGMEGIITLQAANTERAGADQR